MKNCKSCDFLKEEKILERTRDMCAREKDTGWFRYPTCHDQRTGLGPKFCGPDGDFWQSASDDGFLTEGTKC